MTQLERMIVLKKRYGYEISQTSKMSGKKFITFTFDGLNFKIHAKAKTLPALERELRAQKQWN